MYVTDPAFRLPGSLRPPAEAVSTCPSPVLWYSTSPNRPHTPSPRPFSPGATGRSAGLIFAGPDALLRWSMCSWRPMRQRGWSTSAIRRRCAAVVSGRTGSRRGAAAERSRSPRRSGTAGTPDSGGGPASGAIGTVSSSLRHVWRDACTSASRRRFQLKLRPFTRRLRRWGCRWRSDAVAGGFEVRASFCDARITGSRWGPAHRPRLVRPLAGPASTRQVTFIPYYRIHCLCRYSMMEGIHEGDSGHL